MEQQLTPPSRGTTMVTFAVADENDVIVERIMVHKNHACFYSPVLHTALNSIFAEGLSQTYTFRTTTVRAVRFLVEWIYSQQLELVQVNKKPNEFLLKAQVREEDSSLAELWVLADELMMPQLQNQVVSYMEQIAHVMDKPPAACVFKYIYSEKTGVDSPPRKAVVLLSVAYSEEYPYLLHAAEFPHAMLIDILQRMAEIEGDIVRTDLLAEYVKEAYVEVPEAI
ncbi:hypothetical protein BDZ45DRAFT_695901 [Acephala macrosclerotiorum]|nr:hypothetical protein BDZ45DRAFT_695901 [Acephala macrosclerotiorum]